MQRRDDVWVEGVEGHPGGGGGVDIGGTREEVARGSTGKGVRGDPDGDVKEGRCRTCHRWGRQETGSVWVDCLEVGVTGRPGLLRRGKTVLPWRRRRGKGRRVYLGDDEVQRHLYVGGGSSGELTDETRLRTVRVRGRKGSSTTYKVVSDQRSRFKKVPSLRGTPVRTPDPRRLRRWCYGSSAVRP